MLKNPADTHHCRQDCDNVGAVLGKCQALLLKVYVFWWYLTSQFGSDERLFQLLVGFCGFLKVVIG